jgi:hypothetical protein
MLKDEIEKKKHLKKGPKQVTWVNLSNLRLGSLDRENPIEKKIKINYEIQFPISPLLKNETKKSIKNEHKIWPKSWDWDSFIEKKKDLI